MSKHTLHTNIYLDDEEVPVEVSFNYWPTRPGLRDRFGAPETPDDPEDMEILEVRRYASSSLWDVIEVPDDVMHDLEAQVWDAIATRLDYAE